jgi:hypothetical protein
VAQYERSRNVQLPEDDVFAFISDVSNLAMFVPTVNAMEPQGEGRVRIRGERGGRTYEDDGWFHVEPARRRLEWGDDEREYSGWMTVSGEDGGSQVVAHLSVPPYVDQSGRPITGELPEHPDRVAESLEASLDSLRNVLEGRGGKVEPRL